VLCVAVAACGGDNGMDSDENTAPTDVATMAVGGTPTAEAEASATGITEGEPLPDFSGEDVCALNTPAEVGAALGVTIEGAEPSSGGTPSCSYTFTTPEGTGNNVVVAVMRSSDVGGRSGTDAFEFAVEVNRRYSDGAAEQEVDVGDDALYMDGAAVGLLIIRQGERVMTIAGTTITVEAATAIARAATGRL
jgi:hypothetical protein